MTLTSLSESSRTMHRLPSITELLQCQFQAGKYYTFVINIAGANGNTTPDDSEKDDPTVTATNEIRLISVTITDYENGGTQTHTIN